MIKDQHDNHPITCSFCGKNSEHVNKIIKGAYVNICNECITLCYGMLDNTDVKKDVNVPIYNIPSTIELKNYLDEYVVGQDSAKKILSVSIINHLKRIMNKNSDVVLEKENVLMVGPSGTGKTLLVKTLANKLNLPCVICDSTVLSEVGYVGADPDSLIKKLYINSNHDINKTQHGIVFIDEIDKKAKKNISSGKDASGEGVQQALLKLIEGTVVELEIGDGNKTNNVSIDTTNILFIVSGAFSGIENIINKRENINKIGFGLSTDSVEKSGTLIPDDIINYGIIPELVGRLPIIAILEKLNREQMKQVLLDTKNSLIKQYKKLFELENITLDFHDDCIDYIIDQSINEKTGIRGIRNIIESKLIDVQFEIPNYIKSGISEIIIPKSFYEHNSDPIFRIFEK
ncbi:MAG: ATP-dependent protease ATP-binding subunit [Caudoviricetes sp.]|nr:MAG: ATP-dependent protease ATP-binding subunit [Caudoviricetes sp.]